MKDLYQNRCQQLKSQKHLHLYTHFSSVSLISHSLFVCIIGTLKNGLVLAFYLYLTRVICHCRSLFSCFLVRVEIHVPPRVDNPLLHNPIPSTPAALSCRASASASSPFLAWWGQGSSKTWCLSCAVQQAREAWPQGGAMGSLHTSCSCHGWLLPRPGQSGRTKMFKNSCHMAIDL